jgi:predicted nucleic acid-binding protein
VILVDSDVIIDFFAGAEPGAPVLSRLLAERQAAVSAVSAFEIRAGVTGRRRIEQVERLLSLVPVLPFDREQAELAAAFYTELKGRGALVGNQDLFLAAAASRAGIPVLTRNAEHFRRIAAVEVVTPEELSA